MDDVLLIATIVAFFLAASLLVRACGHITDRAQDEGESGETSSDLSPPQPA